VDECTWLASTEPQAMLEFLWTNGKLSERKARLFACACCRRIWPFLIDTRARKAVKVAERFADGAATPTERRNADKDALKACRSANPHYRNWWTTRDSAELACLAASASISVDLPADHRSLQAANFATHAIGRSPASNFEVVRKNEQQAQCCLLRDLFGPLLYREIRIDPSWLAWNNGIIRKLALVIHDERILPEGMLDQSRLAILADALQEAGCDNEEILFHCRSQGDHVRGCWLIDLILGKL
jgi:hypothetical protein